MSQPITFADIMKAVDKVTSLSNQSMLLVNSSGNLSKSDSNFTPLMLTKIWTTGDLNDLTVTGLYMFFGQWKHRPSGVNTAGAVLLVTSHSTGYVSQILIAISWQSGKGIYYRSMEPDGWKDWYKVGASIINTVS